MMAGVVYVSSATSRLTREALVELLRVSRENNARRGITGMLLYHEGNFIQALDGPHDAVRALCATIAADPRHRGMLMLLDERIDAPRFPEWAMGFRDLGEAAKEPGFSDVLVDDLSARALAANPARAMKLLTTFRRGLR